MSELAQLIQSVLHEEGLSPERAALRAGIATTTVYRWMQGTHQPRMQELESFLQLSRVPLGVLHQALARIQAPRAVQFQRKLLETVRPEALPVEATMPALGDVLRALRQRQHLTARQVAQMLRTSPSVITRWEQSADVPSPERLQSLLKLLGASERECTLLSQGQVQLIPPLSQQSQSEAELAHSLACLRAQADAEAQFPGDLYYLAFEAHLWRLLPHPAALRLLVQTWLQHAQYLLWQGRLAEMHVYARRVLEVARPPGVGEEHLVAALGLAAHFIAHGRGKGEFTRAAAYLKGHTELVEHYPDGATIYRDMGEYFGMAGHYEEGIRLAQHSRAIAEKQNCEEAQRMAALVEARLWVSQGRAENALPLLVQEEGVIAGVRLYELLELARALLQLGDTSEAAYWLEQFFALVESTGREHMRSHGTYLASML